MNLPGVHRRSRLFGAHAGLLASLACLPCMQATCAMGADAVPFGPALLSKQESSGTLYLFQGSLKRDASSEITAEGLLYVYDDHGVLRTSGNYDKERRKDG